MQTYFSNIIPSLARYSKKLDDISLLTTRHWVILDESSQSKSTYIFRNNNELIVSENGIVVHGTWDYLGFNKILLRINNSSFLFQHGFLEDDILALKLDGRNEYAFFINESRSDLNTLKRIDTLNIPVKVGSSSLLVNTLILLSSHSCESHPFQ